MGNIFSKPKSIKATLKDLCNRISEGEKKHKALMKAKTKTKWRVFFLSALFVLLSVVYASLDDQSIPVFFFLPLCLSLTFYWATSFYFAYRIDSYAIFLDDLKDQRREQIERLKEEENFLETVELVDRFEGDTTRHLHFSKINQKNKGVLETVTDVVLGGDPSKLYALICRECHYHNGMVPPDHKGIDFVCYNCNTLNSKKEIN